jgi:hypothetical protein
MESLEARMEGTNGRSIAPFTPASHGPRSVSLPERVTIKPAERSGVGPRRAREWTSAPGIKRRTPKQIREDMPPVPRGCEWRRSDDGWNLWRCWSEQNEDQTGKIKKSRYAGTLSHDAWQIMKEYDHEAILSVVGQRLRRHGRG